MADYGNLYHSLQTLQIVFVRQDNKTGNTLALTARSSIFVWPDFPMDSCVADILFCLEKGDSSWHLSALSL